MTKGVGFTALSKKAAPPTRPRMERGKEWKEVEVTVIKGQYGSWPSRSKETKEGKVQGQPSEERTLFHTF